MLSNFSLIGPMSFSIIGFKTKTIEVTEIENLSNQNNAKIILEENGDVFFECTVVQKKENGIVDQSIKVFRHQLIAIIFTTNLIDICMNKSPGLRLGFWHRVNIMEEKVMLGREDPCRQRWRPTSLAYRIRLLAQHFEEFFWLSINSYTSGRHRDLRRLYYPIVQ